MIKFKQKGNLSRTTKWLRKIQNGVDPKLLEQYGEEGVRALQSATPVQTGKTATSWYYEIDKGRDYTKISFANSNIQNGVQIAILLQYGHGTRNGGWVEGRDYINPAIQPVFDKLAQHAWKEVVK